MLDVLIIAPHPDDAELGMGGAIFRFLAAGKKVGILDLTNGEPTPHGSPEIRARETAAATKILALIGGRISGYQTAASNQRWKPVRNSPP